LQYQVIRSFSLPLFRLPMMSATFHVEITGFSTLFPVSVPLHHLTQWSPQDHNQCVFLCGWRTQQLLPHVIDAVYEHLELLGFPLEACDSFLSHFSRDPSFDRQSLAFFSYVTPTVPLTDAAILQLLKPSSAFLGHNAPEADFILWFECPAHSTLAYIIQQNHGHLLPASFALLHPSS
jgi:hypothetical protein